MTTILLSAVYADPLVELADLSAERLVPLFAVVTTTEKCVEVNITYGSPQISLTLVEI